MKEIEELMKPRFKVIADYPDRKFPMEEVIHLKLYEGTQKPIPNTWYGIEVKGSPGIWDEAYFEKYPHLFRKLCWWEERSIEDMPEFVKDSNRVYKTRDFREVNGFNVFDIYGWKAQENGVGWSTNNTLFFKHENITPATLQEYQSYQSINSLK